MTYCISGLELRLYILLEFKCLHETRRNRSTKVLKRGGLSKRPESHRNHAFATGADTRYFNFQRQTFSQTS